MNFAEVPYRYPARYIIVDGFRIAYVDVNPDAGNPVLFLHEAGGSLDHFAPAYERLSESRRALGIDLIGFGKSDKPPVVDDHVPFYTELLGRFLTEIDVERASLVGHGLGALVAARFAALHPNRVGRLVLSALPGTRETTDDERATALDLWSFERLHGGGEAGRRSWLEGMVAGWNDALDDELSLLNGLADSLGYRPWAHAVEGAQASVQRNPAGDLLGRIEAPTLLVWGVDDPITPASCAAEARAAIRGARLAGLERCGHLPMLECPDLFVDAIASFLLGASARASGSLSSGSLKAPTAREAEDLEPWPGLSPEIGRLARVLFEQRDACVHLTAGLSLDDVAWKPSRGANSVGAVLLHMGGNVVWYLYEVLLGEEVPADLCAKYYLDPGNPDAPLEAPRKSAGRLVADVEVAHERLLEWLKARSDADLNRTFTSRDGSFSATLRWVLWHLVEDTLHHRGQVAYVRRLLSER